MNGIFKYHSGIIATGMCTIEDVSGTEWYSTVMNTIQVSLRPVSLPLWTSVVLNGISKYHSGIIATGKCTIENQ